MFGFLVLNMHFYKWSYYNIKKYMHKNSEDFRLQ